MVHSKPLKLSQLVVGVNVIFLLSAAFTLIMFGIKNSRSSSKFLKKRQLNAQDCTPANKHKGAIICHSGNEARLKSANNWCILVDVEHSAAAIAKHHVS